MTASGRPTHVLGVNCYMHDSAVCLLRDGAIVAFAEEERFSRQKHTSSFPHGALRWALEKGGIRGIIMEAVLQATRRSEALGKDRS